MSESSKTAGCASALAAALGAEKVDLPGSELYGARLSGIYSAAAAHSSPACIVRPEGAEDIAAALAIASEHGVTVTARGGGLSVLAARTGAVVIDLAAHLNHVAVPDDTRVNVSGGATTGTMNDTLGPHGRAVPAGVSPLPGLGMALRGGIGHVSRAFGLTIDHLDEVEIALPTGTVRRVSGKSTGEDADLWWAVRGAGPMVGVVSEASLVPVPLPAVTHRRVVLPLDATARALELGPTLPNSVSQSLVLGPPAHAATAPVLLADTVAVGTEAEAGELISTWSGALGDEAGGPERLLDQTARVAYADIAAFDVPGLGNSPSAALLGGPVHVFVKSYLLTESAGASAAELLVREIQRAPTRLCRIDMQHAGGAVDHVDASDSAFANRDWHWNCVVTAAWTGHGHNLAAERWVHGVIQGLSPWISGVYSVEIRPDRPETSQEVGLAFKDNLPRLREVADRADPERILLSHQLLD